MTVRHFIDLWDYTADDLKAILNQSLLRKKARKGLPKGAVDTDKPLEGYKIALIFAHPSTRTRVSFEMAMHQLGGSSLILSQSEMQLGRGETIEDTARVLSRYVDGIMIRTSSHDDVKSLAECGSIPVINGLTSFSHPCQIMADLLTLWERWGQDLTGRQVAWLGDGNNVCQSWIQAAVMLGMKMNIVTPAGFEPDANVMQWAKENGGDIRLFNTLDGAIEGSDCVMTDTWVSMGQKDSDARLTALSPFRVTEAVMKQAKSDAIFMHCLPAHRGDEVEDSVIDGRQSVIFDEAENRLHAQKGVLLWCLKQGS